MNIIIEKCIWCGGKTEKTEKACDGLSIQRCTVCNRHWTMGFPPKKKTTSSKPAQENEGT